MKNIFLSVAAAILVCAGLAHADITVQQDGSNLGVVTKINVTGCTATRSGMIATVDCQTVDGPISITGNLSVSGTLDVTSTSTFTGAAAFNGGVSRINWAAIPQGLTTGVNWTGAMITGQGINWQNVKAYGSSFGGDHSGINWPAFGI